jgi:COP9 signalosome complex subunit 6
LPISLFESVEEIESDQVQLRFRELQFEVETGDAEMIGVDFVAKGGGNATAVRKVETNSPVASGSKDKKGKGKGKAKEEDGQTNGASSTHDLSAEDDELISSLNAKVNAIKMLNERLDLIRSYLTSLPPSYLSDATSKDMPENVNYTLLRSVNSMLSRLPLLTSPAPDSQASLDADGTAPPSSLQQAERKEKQDVHLTSLLANLTRSVAEAQSLSSKFGVLQREKANKDRAPFGGRNGRMGMGAGEENMLMDSGNGGF